MRTEALRARWFALAWLIVVTIGPSGPVLAQRAQRGPEPLDVSVPVSVFIGQGDDGIGFRSSDRQLARWALDVWAKRAGASLRETTSESDAVLRVYWAGPADGRYGEMQPLVVGSRTGAALFVRPDLTALDPQLARAAAADPLLRETIVYLTCVHELGHAFGLSHTSDFRDIMYFFGYGGDIMEFFQRYRRQLRVRDDLGSIPVLSAGDAAAVSALYRR